VVRDGGWYVLSCVVQLHLDGFSGLLECMAIMLAVREATGVCCRSGRVDVPAVGTSRWFSSGGSIDVLSDSLAGCCLLDGTVTTWMTAFHGQMLGLSGLVARLRLVVVESTVC
jgi:hypothetical protein